MKYVNFCLVMVLTFALSAGMVDTKTSYEGYYPGDMIPNLVFTDINGVEHLLHDYRGKKVVVNFWASYDAQSRAANVLLHNTVKHIDADIVFLSVSFDENRNVVERTVALDNIDSVSLFCETDGSESKLFKNLRLKNGFRNYLIGENGEIAAMNVNPEDLKIKL